MIEKENWWFKALSWVLFIIYLLFLFYFLFFSEHYGRTDEVQGYRYNLVLFKEINRFITYRHVLGFEGFMVNIFGNVLAFAPFGFCLPIISKNDDKFLKVLLGSFSFSLMIEIIQLIYKIGCFDVDDMLLNTIGGILGFFAYRIIKWIKKRSKNRRADSCLEKKSLLNLGEERNQ